MTPQGKPHKDTVLHGLKQVSFGGQEICFMQRTELIFFYIS